MNAAEAKNFVSSWLEAANSHDLERIMAFYAPDAEIESPMVVSAFNVPNGRIKGEAAIRKYFGQSVTKYNMQLIESAVGVSSITAWYANNRGTRTSAYIELGPDGKITRNVSHYNE